MRLALSSELSLDPSPTGGATMLDAFLVTERDTIIARTRARVAARAGQLEQPTPDTKAISLFVDQLGAALRMAGVTDAIDHDQIGRTAAKHGHDALRTGRPVAQVVHDYGDVCQVIAELAVERGTPISGAELRTLNLCLDDAIGSAVSEYARQRQLAIEHDGTERLGALAHELRNQLNSAVLSFEVIKTGHVGLKGSTTLAFDRSLIRLRNLIDRSLANVRLEAALDRRERISVIDFVEEVEMGAKLQADASGIKFAVRVADGSATIEGDREILAAALSNLLQNAFKFTRAETGVSLTAHATRDRVLFDVEDECGGLPRGACEDLLRPFVQRGTNRSGLGLGLSICVKAALANGGEIRVRDLPGKGCIFTLDLPRGRSPRALPAMVAHADG
jgi:signal transduction histidine kinase